jgi:hypothetical protein
MEMKMDKELAKLLEGNGIPDRHATPDGCIGCVGTCSDHHVASCRSVFVGGDTVMKAAERAGCNEDQIHKVWLLWQEPL